MTTPISNTPSFKGMYLIKSSENRHIKYLANHLSDLVKKEHLSARFTTDVYELNTATVQQNKNVQNKLKELFVNYILKK